MRAIDPSLPWSETPGDARNGWVCLDSAWPQGTQRPNGGRALRSTEALWGEGMGMEVDLMKAIVQDCYGPTAVLRSDEVEPPRPTDHQVLVRVRCASVNALDWHIMRGTPFVVRLLTGLSRPKVRVRGRDLSGIVEECGPSVTRWKPGDPVFGTANGTFAEFVTTPESDLSAKPQNVTFAAAASVPVAGVTALQAIRDHGHQQPGQQTIVYGAGGGVGTMAVQVARSLGGHVTAVTSTDRVDLLESLGAETVIDYSRTDFADGQQRYDLFIDIGADRKLRDCLRVLAREGTYVGVGSPPDTGMVSTLAGLIGQKLASAFVHQRLSSFIAKPNQRDLDLLGQLMSSKSLQPVIGRRFPFRETAAAIDFLRTGHPRGKVIVEVTEGED